MRLEFILSSELAAFVKHEARTSHQNPSEWVESLIWAYARSQASSESPPEPAEEPRREIEHLRKDNEDLRQEILLLKLFSESARSQSSRSDDSRSSHSLGRGTGDRDQNGLSG